jgi:2-iminobutanoate/2-iminopropanoate deaminase
MKHKRTIINSKYTNKALGPFNQAILIDRTLYISGQLGLDPHTSQIVEGGVTKQAIQVQNTIFKAYNIGDHNWTLNKS